MDCHIIILQTIQLYYFFLYNALNSTKFNRMLQNVIYSKYLRIKTFLFPIEEFNDHWTPNPLNAKVAFHNGGVVSIEWQVGMTPHSTLPLNSPLWMLLDQHELYVIYVCFKIYYIVYVSSYMYYAMQTCISCLRNYFLPGFADRKSVV